MGGFNWEDPFGYHTPSRRSLPLLSPGEQTYPINLEFVRAQQQALLPIFAAVRDDAHSVIQRVKGSAKLGGDTLLQKTEIVIEASVFYRLPDFPNVIQPFGPIPITDHAVVLSAKRNDIPSVIADGLFMSQYLPQVAESGAKPLIDKMQKEVGLIEREGLGPDTPSDHVLVVYPRLLDFLDFWIRKIDGAIAHVVQWEVLPERSTRAGHYIDTPRSDRKHTLQ